MNERPSTQRVRARTLLTAIDPRAPILIGGLVYLVLTLHVAALSRRAGGAGTIAARPAAERRA